MEEKREGNGLKERGNERRKGRKIVKDVRKAGGQARPTSEQGTKKGRGTNTWKEFQEE